jgi:outer membrane protein OmpA-like peptidoglycan-associated protein
MRPGLAAASLLLLATPSLATEGVLSAEEIARRLAGEADAAAGDVVGTAPRPVAADRSRYRHLPVAVTFASGRTDLGEEGRSALEGVLHELRPIIDGEVPVIVAAHTDASGSAAANRRVSQARAEAVRDYIALRLQQPPSRIEALGLGESELLPALPPEDPRQRRVELLLGPAEAPTGEVR